jgi:hypothetical protein
MIPKEFVQPQTYERIAQINAALKQDEVYSPTGRSKAQLSVDPGGNITLSRVVPARYSHLCLGITKKQQLAILQVGGLMPSGQSGRNGLTFAELFELAGHVASVFGLTALQGLNQGRDVINNVVISSGGGIIDTNKGEGVSLFNPDMAAVYRKTQIVPHIGIIPTY